MCFAAHIFSSKTGKINNFSFWPTHCDVIRHGYWSIMQWVLKMPHFYTKVYGNIGKLLNPTSFVRKKGKKMAEYQKMYYILCDSASRALDALPDAPETQAARLLLQQALYEAEELYIATADE